MSRLWPERLYVALAPDGAALVRVSGLLRPRLSWTHRVESDRPLEALRAELVRLGNARLRVSVVLSNRYVRYALVPFDAAVSGAAETLALARFHFTRIYGERAKDWDLRVDEAPRGAPWLACALDAGLVDSIRACFPAAGGARLVSVQPYLMAAYNRWRDRIAHERAWLVLAERGGACFALAGREGWRAVRSLRLGEDGALVDQLEREQLRASGAPRAALVHGSVPESIPGWTLARLALPPLDGATQSEDAGCAMALCAR